MSNLVLIGREAPDVSMRYSSSREVPDVSILLDTSIPFSEDELLKAYTEFQAEIKAKGEIKAVREKLFQIFRDLFSDELFGQVYGITEIHLKIEPLDFCRLSIDDQYRILVYGGASYLAKKYREEMNLSEIVSWALSILILSDSWVDNLKAVKERLILLNSAAEKIVIHENCEKACGLEKCPFHQWTSIAPALFPMDSICSLPDEGDDILYSASFDEEKRRERKLEVNAAENIYLIKRVPKCLMLGNKVGKNGSKTREENDGTEKK
jgi:hypothetical protein